MATIVKAKIKKTNGGGKEELSDYWTRTAGNTVDGKHAQLRALGFNDRNSFMDLSTAEPLNKSATLRAQTEQAKGNALNAAGSTGWDESAKLQTLSFLDDAYKAADKMGYKTADQFRTAYDQLKGASPRTKALTNDPKWIAATQGEGANLRDVAAEHFSRMVKGRDEESAKSKSAPVMVDKIEEKTKSVMTPAGTTKLKVTKTAMPLKK